MKKIDELKLTIYESMLIENIKNELINILHVYESNQSKDMVFKYEKLKTADDIKELSNWMKIIFHEKNSMSDKVTKETMRKILHKNEFIGYVGFNEYNIENRKYLGIGNLMVLPVYQRNGYGTSIIKDIIRLNHTKYDEIYCYVDKNNIGALKFYKKIANVNKSPNDDGNYYVTLYKKST